jgi:hypothetical protein
MTVTGLEELQKLLNAVGEKAPDAVAKVVGRGAFNIKKDWQAAWRGLSYVPALSGAVSYDVTRTTKVIRAEIGPDKKKRQGPLGNVIEFGTVNNPPHPGGLPALDRERPRFEEALIAAVADLLGA